METDQEPSSELSTLTPIRVETALSRFPVHRLAKRGSVEIDIRDESDAGEVMLRWEVSHNSKYGQPGPLAYKVDTLIVNRRIEESNRPIPKIIRLGSLRDICRELGLNEGQATRHVKNALYQNAFAGITAKTRYRQNDGSERTLEAGFTRYSVVFTGEKLPDGRSADGVYLILNEVYMKVINGAMTRPLDYDYLRGLPPAPQRFYELLSYQMYATLKHDRARARLTYSNFCMYAPQTRYLDWEHVRKQMAKVHAPHLKSGYILKAEFDATTDSDGKPDWAMLYTPGPKARAEYRAFTRKGGAVRIEIEPIPLEPEFSAPKATQLKLAFDEEPPPLAVELIHRGVTEATARELVQLHPQDRIEAKLEVFDWLTGREDKRIEKSPAGYLVKSIADDFATPKGFISAAEQKRRAEARQAKEREAAEARRRKHEEKARDHAEQQAIAAYWKSLTPKQQAELDAAAAAQADPETLALESGPVKRMGQQLRRELHIRQLLNAQAPASAEA